MLARVGIFLIEICKVTLAPDCKSSHAGLHDGEGTFQAVNLRRCFFFFEPRVALLHLALLLRVRQVALRKRRGKGEERRRGRKSGGPPGRPSAVSHQHPGAGGDPLANIVAPPAQVA